MRCKLPCCRRVSPGANPEPQREQRLRGELGAGTATLPLNGLVLSEEFCQCLGPCCSKVIALGQEEVIQSLSGVLAWALNTLVRQRVRPWHALNRRVAPFRFCLP